MRFPNLLWAIRENRLAQFELAARVGVSESKMSRAINGRLDLSADERHRIADALGYPVAWLFRPMTQPRAQHATKEIMRRREARVL